jgi:predicted RecA/RadA family phage recombinase
MSKNEVYARGVRRVITLNVGNTTTLPGGPVQSGSYVGVAETASDGGVGAGGYTGLVSQSTGQAINGLQPGFAAVSTNGVYRLPVVTAAAAKVGDWVYIKNDNTLTTVATGAVKFGQLFEAVAGVVTAPGASVMVDLIPFVTS